jgi:predicted adenylyl cyclase CyaB
VKSREELETSIGDPDAMEAALVALGYRRWFASEKYREEYDFDRAHLTIDDTPAGVFVEIEAEPEEIARIAKRLNRSEADYRLDSYPSLWRQWCERRGQPLRDMLFVHAKGPSS